MFIIGYSVTTYGLCFSFWHFSVFSNLGEIGLNFHSFRGGSSWFSWVTLDLLLLGVFILDGEVIWLAYIFFCPGVGFTMGFNGLWVIVGNSKDEIASYVSYWVAYSSLSASIF